MNKDLQANLFDLSGDNLPHHYQPVHPPFLEVERIYLCKGSLDTAERELFIQSICDLYPDAEIIHCLEVSHNRIEIEHDNIMDLHRKGKRSLVFGVLGDSVRFSTEEGNTCPNYWHFSTTGFCPYGCKYCYLSGTQGIWYSPTLKIFS